MSTNSIYGEIFLSDEFESDATDMISLWINTYLKEVERRSGITAITIDRPRSYSVVSDVEKWPEDGLPAVFVVGASMDGDLQRVGGGMYYGWWNWSVVAIVGARDESSTRRLAQLYGAALRACCTQKAGESLGATEFLDESLYSTYVTERSRSLAVVALEFRTLIEGLVQEHVGPTEPEPDDVDDPTSDPDNVSPVWPVVATTNVEVSGESIG